MTSAEDRDPDYELDDVRGRARQRWQRTIVIAGLVGGLGGGVGPALFDHHRHSGGHHRVVALVVALVVLAVLTGGVVAFLEHRSRGWSGMFAAPLAGGLPRRRRRAVARAIRRGTPSDDLTQRSVEVDSAHRLVVYGRRSAWILAAFVAGELAEAVFGDHNTGIRQTWLPPLVSGHVRRAAGS